MHPSYKVRIHSCNPCPNALPPKGLSQRSLKQLQQWVSVTQVVLDPSQWSQAWLQPGVAVVPLQSRAHSSTHRLQYRVSLHTASWSSLWSVKVTRTWTPHRGWKPWINHVNIQKHSYSSVRSGDGGQEDSNRGGQGWWFGINTFMKVRVFLRSNSFANRQQDPKVFETERGAGSSMCLKDWNPTLIGNYILLKWD